MLWSANPFSVLVLFGKDRKGCNQNFSDTLTQYQYCTPAFGRALLTLVLYFILWRFPIPFYFRYFKKTPPDFYIRRCFLGIKSSY